MAKSARASTNKVNKSKLRKKVFGPIEHARLLRSSEKLMDIALNHPKPDRPKKNDMEVESTEESKEDEYPKDMDVDGDASASAPLKRKRTDTKHKSKHSRRRKPRNQISFPQFRGKGALKPHGEHRVKKQR